MSGLVERIRRVANGHPRAFGALRAAVRGVVRGYWWLREALEPFGIWIKVRIFWAARARWRAAVEVAAARFARARQQADCILSFMGMMRRIDGPVHGKLVVMVAVADIRHDPRIEREARALAQAGFAIRIVFPKTTNWDDGPIDWGPGISFATVAEQAAQFCFRWPGFIGDELYAALLADRPFAIHAHDLNMAFIAFAAARRTGAKVVCDFHEWYSENVTYDSVSLRFTPHSWPQRSAYRWLERHCLKRADAVITVCDSIADAMANELGDGRRPEVVRNIPSLAAVPTREYRPLKQELGLPEGRFVLLYQGGLGPSRLIEPIVEALAFAPGCTLVIRGPNLKQWGPGYTAIATRIGAGDRLILVPPVPSRDVVAAARGADAGIWNLPNLCRNFSYALPNKVFEYMASGLPLLVADYPETSRLVDRFDVGRTFRPDEPQSIAAAINSLVAHADERDRLARNTQIALTAMDATHEWQRVVSIYADLKRSAAQNAAA